MKIKFSKDKNKRSIAIMAGIVAILLVSTILIQFKSVDQYKEQDLEGMRDDELKTQIATYKSKYEETQKQYQDNQNKIKEYNITTSEDKETSNLLDSELEESRSLLGLTDVKGQGVIVTLTDSDEAQFSSENIRYLINELKYAGAEAISINGNRVINLTDIVTINDSFIVMNGNIRLNSPYEVKAIGDRKYLTSTLNMKNSGFVDLMKSNNLDVDVKESDNITINKYDGEIKNDYMKEAGE